MQRITRRNPEIMSKPMGRYSHVTKVPRGASITVTSGQIGTNIDGTVPLDLNNQITNTFENIKKVLESEGLTEENIIKVNIWATEEIDWSFLYPQWDELFGISYPSMTLAYVSALGRPELKIEIELWCAEI